MELSMIRGVMPALVTPMDAQGVFQPAPLEHLCDAVYKAGVHGVYVCGSTGEGLQQSVEQRKKVTECVVKNTPSGKVVMVHVGASSTEDAVALARHAADAGAHSVSALPPSGGVFSIDEVHDYYAAIAAASDLPFFIYFFPGFSARPAGIDDLRRLCGIKNVAGLKFTSTDLFTLWKLKNDGVTIFNGYDEILCAGLIMGADGGIGTFYNVAPELVREIYDAVAASDVPKAQAAQAKFNRVIELALRFPGHAACKEMLAWQGIDCGYTRGPRANLTQTQKRDLHAAMESLDLPKR